MQGSPLVAPACVVEVDEDAPVAPPTSSAAPSPLSTKRSYKQQLKDVLAEQPWSLHLIRASVLLFAFMFALPFVALGLWYQFGSDIIFPPTFDAYCEAKAVGTPVLEPVNSWSSISYIVFSGLLIGVLLEFQLIAVVRRLNAHARSFILQFTSYVSADHWLQVALSTISNVIFYGGPRVPSVAPVAITMDSGVPSKPLLVPSDATTAPDHHDAGEPASIGEKAAAAAAAAAAVSATATVSSSTPELVPSSFSPPLRRPTPRRVDYHHPPTPEPNRRQRSRSAIPPSRQLRSPPPATPPAIEHPTPTALLKQRSFHSSNGSIYEALQEEDAPVSRPDTRQSLTDMASPSPADERAITSPTSTSSKRSRQGNPDTRRHHGRIRRWSLHTNGKKTPVDIDALATMEDEEMEEVYELAEHRSRGRGQPRTTTIPEEVEMGADTTIREGRTYVTMIREESPSRLSQDSVDGLIQGSRGLKSPTRDQRQLTSTSTDGSSRSNSRASLAAQRLIYGSVASVKQLKDILAVSAADFDPMANIGAESPIPRPRSSTINWAQQQRQQSHGQMSIVSRLSANESPGPSSMQSSQIIETQSTPPPMTAVPPRRQRQASAPAIEQVGRDRSTTPIKSDTPPASVTDAFLYSSTHTLTSPSSGDLLLAQPIEYQQLSPPADHHVVIEIHHSGELALNRNAALDADEVELHYRVELRWSFRTSIWLSILYSCIGILLGVGSFLFHARFDYPSGLSDFAGMITLATFALAFSIARLHIPGRLGDMIEQYDLKALAERLELKRRTRASFASLFTAPNSASFMRRSRRVATFYMPFQSIRGMVFFSLFCIFLIISFMVRVYAPTDYTQQMFASCFGIAIILEIIHTVVRLVRSTSASHATSRNHIGLLLLAFTLFGFAFMFWNLDVNRTLCYPHSVFQGHSMWHFLTALAYYILFCYYMSESSAVYVPAKTEREVTATQAATAAGRLSSATSIDDIKSIPATPQQ